MADHIRELMDDGRFLSEYARAKDNNNVIELNECIKGTNVFDLYVKVVS